MQLKDNLKTHGLNTSLQKHSGLLDQLSDKKENLWAH
jgi:hypothetical protein